MFYVGRMFLLMFFLFSAAASAASSDMEEVSDVERKVSELLQHTAYIDVHVDFPRLCRVMSRADLLLHAPRARFDRHLFDRDLDEHTFEFAKASEHIIINRGIRRSSNFLQLEDHAGGPGRESIAQTIAGELIKIYLGHHESPKKLWIVAGDGSILLRPVPRGVPLIRVLNDKDFGGIHHDALWKEFQRLQNEAQLELVLFGYTTGLISPQNILVQGTVEQPHLVDVRPRVFRPDEETVWRYRNKGVSLVLGDMFKGSAYSSVSERPFMSDEFLFSTSVRPTPEQIHEYTELQRDTALIRSIRSTTSCEIIVMAGDVGPRRLK